MKYIDYLSHNPYARAFFSMGILAGEGVVINLLSSKIDRGENVLLSWHVYFILLLVTIMCLFEVRVNRVFAEFREDAYVRAIHDGTLQAKIERTKTLIAEGKMDGNLMSVAEIKTQRGLP